MEVVGIRCIKEFFSGSRLFTTIILKQKCIRANNICTFHLNSCKNKTSYITFLQRELQSIFLKRISSILYHVYRISSRELSPLQFRTRFTCHYVLKRLHIMSYLHSDFSFHYFFYVLFLTLLSFVSFPVLVRGVQVRRRSDVHHRLFFYIVRNS